MPRHSLLGQAVVSLTDGWRLRLSCVEIVPVPLGSAGTAARARARRAPFVFPLRMRYVYARQTAGPACCQRIKEKLLRRCMALAIRLLASMPALIDPAAPFATVRFPSAAKAACGSGRRASQGKLAEAPRKPCRGIIGAGHVPPAQVLCTWSWMYLNLPFHRKR